MEYSVEVINLSKSYGKKDAVRGIDFKIHHFDEIISGLPAID